MTGVERVDRCTSRSLHLAAAAGAARGGSSGVVGALRRLRCAHPSGAGAAKLAAFAGALSAQTVAASQKRSAHLRARPQTGGHSHPGTSPPPDSACRSKKGCWLSNGGAPTSFLPRRVRAGRSAPVRRREAQWPWLRAQRASLTDSSHLSEWRERSERSELCDGPRPRASQGSRRAAPTASLKRCGLPAHALAREVQQTRLTVHNRRAS
jgi:hypothetical protein